MQFLLFIGRGNSRSLMALTKHSTDGLSTASAGSFPHGAMPGGNKQYLCVFMLLLGCLIVLL